MLLMLSPGAALLLAGLFAPALFALVADRTPGHALTRTISLFSLAGAMTPAAAFLTSDRNLQAALQILTQPTTLPTAWLFGGCGWLLDEACCLTAAFLTSRRIAARIKALEGTLLAIRTEWEIPDETGPSA